MVLLWGVLVSRGVPAWVNGGVVGLSAAWLCRLGGGVPFQFPSQDQTQALWLPLQWTTALPCGMGQPRFEAWWPCFFFVPPHFELL